MPIDIHRKANIVTLNFCSSEFVLVLTKFFFTVPLFRPFHVFFTRSFRRYLFYLQITADESQILITNRNHELFLLRVKLTRASHYGRSRLCIVRCNRQSEYKPTKLCRYVNTNVQPIIRCFFCFETKVLEK